MSLSRPALIEQSGKTEAVSVVCLTRPGTPILYSVLNYWGDAADIAPRVESKGCAGSWRGPGALGSPDCF